MRTIWVKSLKQVEVVIVGLLIALALWEGLFCWSWSKYRKYVDEYLEYCESERRRYLEEYGVYVDFTPPKAYVSWDNGGIIIGSGVALFVSLIVVVVLLQMRKKQTVSNLKSS
jgi:hypothetical protein